MGTTTTKRSEGAWQDYAHPAERIRFCAMLADLVVSTGSLGGGEESLGTGPPTALPALCCLLCCEAAVARREREDIRTLPRPTVFLMEFISPHSIMQRQGTFPLAYKVPGK